MTSMKTVKQLKPKKTPIVTDPLAEPKKRAPRAKKVPPTREESLKILTDASAELKQIIEDLKEDQMKISCMQLKKVPELLKETISNLEEDVQDIEEEHEELLSKPESQ